MAKKRNIPQSTTEQLLFPVVQQTVLDFGLDAIELSHPTSNLLVAPKIILASSLFTARNKNQPRKSIKDMVLAVAPGHGELKYRGEELRLYDDRKVWQAIIELAREQQIHTTNFTLSTTVYQILKRMGWSTGGKEYEHLKDCLGRLKATALTASSTSGNSIKSVSLISKFSITDAADSKAAQINVVLDPEIYKLFQREDVAFLSSDIMREMPGLTHKVYEVIRANPGQALLISEYMKLSGNEYKHLRQFKARLIVSLNQLKAGRYIVDWSINDEGRVTVEMET